MADPLSSGGSASSMALTRGTISTNVGRCAGTCDMHAIARSCGHMQVSIRAAGRRAAFKRLCLVASA